MKTAVVGGSNKKPNMSGLLIFLLTIALTISSGCIDKHAGILTDWDKTEMPCGFVGADDSDYTELRALATRYGMLEPGVVE